MADSIKKIGVFTSGGDSPGMNAAIRAVVRGAIYHDCMVSGILRGYEGMVNGEFVPLSARSVSNIIQRGGTILKSARSQQFMTSEGRHKAYQNLVNQKIDALIAIGGDGTFAGAEVFYSEFGVPIIGIPGTIDNDLYGTDYTLGFNTAVNTAIEAIDKIRDTAASHDRLFFIEVMGRDAGFIALWAGIAGGAEAILLPEEVTDLDALADLIIQGKRKNKSSNIVIVSEGDDAGGAFEIAKKVKQLHPEIIMDTRVTVLGHIQRGGSPTALDRILGSRFGIAAVEALLRGEQRKMTGFLDNKMALIDFDDAINKQKQINPELLNVLKMTSI